MNQDKKILIVVLGMHRSGTSVMSRALKVIGVDLGSNLLSGVKEENEKGFWEDVDILNLNDEMLHSLSRVWHDLLSVTVEDVEKLKELGFLHRAINLLQDKMKHVQVFGLKDPRFSKLLHFWKQVFTELDIDVNYIVTIRNPLSVSRSLHKRNKFPPEKSLFLWLDHIVASLDKSQDEKRILVDYDLLMENPEKTIRHIADTFNLPVDLEQLNEFKNEFLDSRLRHTIFSTDDLVTNLPKLNIVSDIYLELVKGHLSQHYLNKPTFYAKLEHWKEYINSQEQSWRLISIIDAQYSQASAQLAERDAQLAERDARLAERDARLAERDARLAERDARLAERDARLAERDRLLHEIRSSKSWKIAMIIRGLRMWIMPPNSYQAAVGRFLFRILHTFKQRLFR